MTCESGEGVVLPAAVLTMTGGQVSDTLKVSGTYVGLPRNPAKEVIFRPKEF